MRLIDISLPLTPSLPVWPGDPPVGLERVRSLDKGNECNVTTIRMGVHTGTHVDAPLHFLRDGGGVESIPLGRLIGPCRVVSVDGGGQVAVSALRDAGLEGCPRVLLRTANSLRWRSGSFRFSEDYAALGLEAARYLADAGAELVGIDFLSIEAFSSAGYEVHRFLLQRSIVVLEGLDLSAASPGEYELICLPLRLPGCDGAPARALLRHAPR